MTHKYSSYTWHRHFIQWTIQHVSYILQHIAALISFLFLNVDAKFRSFVDAFVAIIVLIRDFEFSILNGVQVVHHALLDYVRVGALTRYDCREKTKRTKEEERK